VKKEGGFFFGGTGTTRDVGGPVPMSVKKKHGKKKSCWFLTYHVQVGPWGKTGGEKKKKKNANMGNPGRTVHTGVERWAFQKKPLVGGGGPRGKKQNKTRAKKKKKLGLGGGGDKKKNRTRDKKKGFGGMWGA